VPCLVAACKLCKVCCRHVTPATCRWLPAGFQCSTPSRLAQCLHAESSFSMLSPKSLLLAPQTDDVLCNIQLLSQLGHQWHQTNGSAGQRQQCPTSRFDVDNSCSNSPPPLRPSVSLTEAPPPSTSTPVSVFRSPAPPPLPCRCQCLTHFDILSRVDGAAWWQWVALLIIGSRQLLQARPAAAHTS
jgi:hypothetical protein